MRLFKKISLLLIVVICFKLLGQEHPPIQVYQPNDYGAENQNWSFSQTEDKFIYVANNRGLLEFNGSRWNLYPSPNNTIMRSVSVMDHLIYTGCYREFGYWEKNELGTLNYTNLSQRLSIEFLEDEEIWKIIHIDDWILFQSLQRIFIYDRKQNTYNIIKSDFNIYKMFQVENGIFFQDEKGSVFEISNSKPKLVIDKPKLEGRLLVNIFKFDDKLLLLSESNGFYVLHNGNLTKWDLAIDNTLTELKIYSAIMLSDSSFLLGTVSEGVLLLSNLGDVIYKLDQDSGLSNNTVLALFEDAQDNLWLGLENGINCINIGSPFSIYRNLRENIGAVNCAQVFEDNLYLGTNQGLYYRTRNANTEFKFINGTEGAVWSLQVLNNTLVCGHDSGTFTIKNGRANQFSEIRGTWGIKAIPNTSNLFLQGNYSGLYLVENTVNGFSVRNKVAGFDISSRFFEILDDWTVFVNHEYKGVFKLKLTDGATKAIEVTKEPSLKKGLKTSLVKYGDDVLYAHNSGVYRYDNNSNSFIKDSIYSTLFEENEYTSGKLMVVEESNTLWAASLRNLSYLEPTKLTNRPKVKKVPLPQYTRGDVAGYENLSHISENKYLYGNSSGYILIDLDKINQKPFRVNISSIGNSHIKSSDSLKYVNKVEYHEYDNKDNNFEFAFTVPEYKKYLVPEYQYKLSELYNEWSIWSTNSSEFFENLPAGDYTFLVRARIGDVMSQNSAEYRFKVEKPWYYSNKMIAVYVLFILLFSLMMHHIYKRYYKIQQRKLLVTKEREIHRKELENQQQIMRFRNEQLRQDIDTKNRELGMSTMSLIKKNEFLNTIKKELQAVDNVRNLKSVIKIIDRNLNDKDDWHLFEEAFNNADKDFLKKIKSMHPELTPNDLRLCAYLRLNLSSKEIAPLLNISNRSVEVKRYRLRKKLNLDHEANLSDYILEI